MMVFASAIGPGSHKSPNRDEVSFAISISGGHNINERFLKKTKNLWNQRAESSFPELSMKKIELREGLRR
jgi:hypothetical protein